MNRNLLNQLMLCFYFIYVKKNLVFIHRINNIVLVSVYFENECKKCFHISFFRTLKRLKWQSLWAQHLQEVQN